ncbi:hypothetical protein K1X84_00315 [bacterium]|nr:hypothetical protein [bacterium]
MKRWIIYWIISCFYCQAYSQWVEETTAYVPFRNQTGLAVIGDWTGNTFSRSHYTGTKLFFNYDRAQWGFNAFLNINQGQLFDVLPGTLIIQLPDSARIIDADKIKSHADHYETNIPIGIQFSRRDKFWELHSSVQLHTQKETTERPELESVTEDVYYVNFVSKQRHSFDILLNTWAAIHLKRFQLFGGVQSISLEKSKPDSTHYLENLKTKPFFGFQFNYTSGEVLSTVNRSEWQLAGMQTLTFDGRLNANPFRISAAYRRGISELDFQAVQLFLTTSVTPFLQILIGYERIWNNEKKFNVSQFEEWKSSVTPGMDGDLGTQMPHTSFRAGLKYDFGKKKESFPLRSVDMKLFQNTIYIAKRAFYAYNPIGSIDLQNTGRNPVYVRLIAESSNGIAKFQTESIRIEPDEIRTIPVFIFLSEKDLSESSSRALINLTAEIDGRQQVLSSLPVTFFDAHSWDGDTWELKYFTAPNDPIIQSFAKEKLIEIIGQTEHSDQSDKLKFLQNFLTTIGNGLKYVPDPTTTVYVDRVQYPVETLQRKTGDCEDLAVFVASSLMAIGIQCAVVDIRPQTGVQLPTAQSGSVGHVFLIVDTGLEADRIGETGLEEFQTVIRKNMTGKNTIWIPIEVTSLSEGFEKAFREGAREYYQKVIEENGVSEGTVHVYDF